MKSTITAILVVLSGFIFGTLPAHTAAADDSAAGPPTIHAGDVWIDRLSSGDKEYRVTSVNADTVYFTEWGSEMESDLQWNPKVYRSLTTAGATPITYSKPLPLYPFPLTPGKTWTDELRWEIREPAVQGRDEVKRKVDDWEDITVPAGKYHAIKAEVTIRAIGRGGIRDVTNIVYWYAPAANRFVKSHIEGQTEGTVIDSEMVSYTPAKQ